ncbi:MAG TPA: RNA polymerase sigma-70 factor [Pelobium sp.]
MREKRILQSQPFKKDFESLYSEYYRGIFGFVMGYVKSTDIAEDITQDLFLTLLEKQDQETLIANFKAYIFTAAKNRALDYLRTANKDLKLKETLYKNYESLHVSLEDDIADLEYQKLLDYYLDKLSIQNSTVFKLCRKNGKSYKEAAEELGISQSAVKKHMVKSMKILKLLLKKDFGLLLFLILKL